MVTLPLEEIEDLLKPYLNGEGSQGLYERISAYLDLLVKWNARTNLTAIRDPKEMVQRHFGESLFAARHITQCATLLDYGSGAGFPGVPIQLLRPEMTVTLAESQKKKANFLKEVVRTLGLTAEVWDERVEEMPIDRKFDTVTLRAVDDMKVAIREAEARLIPGGQLILLANKGNVGPEDAAFPLPGSLERVLIKRMFHVKHSV